MVAAEAFRRMTNALIAAERGILFGRVAEGWPQDARRILVHRSGNIGDTVVAIPALLAVRHLYPAAEVTLLTCPGHGGLPSAVDVLDGTRIVDDYVVYRRTVGKEFRERLLLAKRLRARGFDLFVSLSSAGGGKRVATLLRDMVFARAAGCRAVGGFHLVSLPQQWAGRGKRARGVVLAESERLLALVPGGLAFWRNTRFEWPTMSELRERAACMVAKHNLDAGTGFVVVHPGAKLGVKRWMPERFGAVACHVSKVYGVKVAITGSAAEETICQKVAQAVEPKFRTNLAGKTNAGELLALLAKAKAVISNDTGAMHLSALFKTPCLAVMSGQDHPAKWKPIGDRHIQLRAEVDCSPCFRVECSSRECLTRITVEEAVRAFDRLWRLHVAPSWCNGTTQYAGPPRYCGVA